MACSIVHEGQPGDDKIILANIDEENYSQEELSNDPF